MLHGSLVKALGIKSAYHENVSNGSLSAGANTLTSGSPSAASEPNPAQYRVITSVGFAYTGTVGGVTIELKAGGVTFYKSDADPTSAQIEEIIPVEIYLDAGETIEMDISGASVNDSADLYLHGYDGYIFDAS